jgi:ribosome biogenesis GTPase
MVYKMSDDHQVLVQWGYDQWFRDRFADQAGPESEPARVIAVHKNSYMVQTALGECQAELTGRLMYAADSALELPTVGDWVQAQVFDQGGLAIVDHILPRKTLLKRKTPGKRVDHQLLGANLDTAFIVQAFGRDFNPRRMERYLAVCHEAGVKPVALLNKCDLAQAQEMESALELIRGPEGKVESLVISAQEGTGLDELCELLKPGHTYCLLGSSGVGKTTLLNRLLGHEAFATQSIREKDAKGRHTTTRRELVMLPTGALLLDTPGMRELGATWLEEGIDQAFDEIGELAQSCRFSDCTHTSEPGCAVLQALEQGGISAQRYQNFLKLRKESDFFQSSYQEKRKKDKEFGKMVKSVIRDRSKSFR